MPTRRATWIPAWIPKVIAGAVAVLLVTGGAWVGGADAAPRPSPRDAVTIDSPTVPGIDVASWQHPNGAPIDWNQVYGAGHRYAFIKATEGPLGCSGDFYTNPYFAGDWRSAGTAGLYRGAYHFAEPSLPISETAIEQARYFVGTTGPMTGARDLMPVLDLEVSCGLAPAELAAWVHAWLDEVEVLTGRKAAITTYPSFWTGPMANNSSFGAYPLWLARYGADRPEPLPAGWRDWAWWQTGQADVPGIRGEVDVNLFNGDLAWLDRYAFKGNPYPISPIGSFDPIQLTGRASAAVRGWTIDADTRDPIDVTVTVDGAPHRRSADVVRLDLGVFWLWGSAHGFDLPVDGLAPGAHTFCVTAHNVDAGNDTSLGCQTATMPTGPPIGGLESVAWRPGGWQIDGWTLDPDTTDAIDISITDDGIENSTRSAASHRADVGVYFPEWGPDHGFSFRHLPIPGPNHLCITATNHGDGHDTTLGCRDLVTPDPHPTGGIILAENLGNALRVIGWTLDPDTDASLVVAATDDGNPSTTTTADIDVPAIGAWFTGFGGRHGFDLTIPLSERPREICIVARNYHHGTDRTLGCGTHAAADLT